MKYSIQYNKNPDGLENWQQHRTTENFGHALHCFKYLIMGEDSELGVLPCVSITEDDYIIIRYQAPPERMNSYYKANKSVSPTQLTVPDLVPGMENWNDVEEMEDFHEHMERKHEGRQGKDL